MLLLLLKTSDREPKNQQNEQKEKTQRENGGKWSENKTMLQIYTIFHMWISNAIAEPKTSGMQNKA